MAKRARDTAEMSGFSGQGDENGSADESSRGVGEDAGQADAAEQQVNTEGNGAATGVDEKKGKSQELKRADFSRLASGRLTDAHNALSRFANLANVNSYDWTAEQHAAIFVALRDKIDTLESAFRAAKIPKEPGKRTSKQLTFRV